MRIPLILDANMLILLVVGLANEGYIAKHERLSAYGVEDFRRVLGWVDQSERLVFVPNVVTETSNLLRQIRDPIRTELTTVFGELLKNTFEQYVPSRDAVNQREFTRLGLTDAVLMKLGEEGAALLTADAALYVAASRAGFRVANYNHVLDRDISFNPWA